MEAVIAALRPKNGSTISQEFRPASYEIMLLDVTVGNSSAKQLPRTTFRFDEEPSDVLCSFLYEITGGECDGLKARRAVFVPAHHKEADADYESSLKGALYALPVDPRDKLCAEILQKSSDTPGFYSLDQVLDTLAAGQVHFVKQSKTMLSRIEKWLEQEHGVPGAIDLLFSACAEDRLTRSVTNPAFFTESQSQFNSVQISEGLTRSIANETLAKMMAIEKCDRTIVNPVYGSEPNYKSLVDKAAVNAFYGMGKPDYLGISRRDVMSGRNGRYVFQADDFPLHTAARQGDCSMLRELIRKGLLSSVQDDDGWCPIHYAAWHGHDDAVSVLLADGECSANLENHMLATPLHVAASNARQHVIKLLVERQDVDIEALDRNGKTAYDYANSRIKDDWRECAAILQDAMDRPVAMVPICLMDGTSRAVKLTSGVNTTVYQMHSQLMRLLELPDHCGHLFTIWICSRNLQLQLQSTHKPIDHLTEWKTDVVVKYTDQDPTREDPALFWRRDAVLLLSQEKIIRDPIAIDLLFNEAYHHYIKNLYPCSDRDALILGGILMQWKLSDYDSKKCQKYFSQNEKEALQQLVPSSKLKHPIKWTAKITSQYRHYSNTMVTRQDRSATVLHQHFLKVCWNLTVYGSAFFTGNVNIRNNSKSTQVYIGVNDIGVHVINSSTKQMVQSLCYPDIEWTQKRSVLEIKQRASDRHSMTINSKQASLVDYLMRKLANPGMLVT